MSFNDCEVCGDWGERIALASVRWAMMCLNHINEWDQYFIDNHADLGKTLSQNVSRARAAIAIGDGNLASELTEKLVEGNIRIRELINDWIAKEKEIRQLEKA